MEISYKRIKKEKNPAQDFSLHGIFCTVWCFNLIFIMRKIIGCFFVVFYCFKSGTATQIGSNNH